MDGFALIAQVRDSPDLSVREIPAAALTAFARSDDRVRAMQSGFQVHMAKPIDPVELLAHRRVTGAAQISRDCNNYPA